MPEINHKLVGFKNNMILNEDDSDGRTNEMIV